VVLDVIMDKESITIPVENPFHADIDGITKRIEGFIS